MEDEAVVCILQFARRAFATENVITCQGSSRNLLENFFEQRTHACKSRPHFAGAGSVPDGNECPGRTMTMQRACQDQNRRLDGRSNGHQGKQKRRSTQRNSNPLQAAIREFLTTLAESSDDPIIQQPLPKRYTIFPPLLLLPANAFSIPKTWGSFYADRLDDQQRHHLYEIIVKAFSKAGVTHLAVSAPIALTDSHGNENRMRSPTGLIRLCGDFGLVPSDGESPTESDFEIALWVHTVQNHGIVQIWSPLYTMFSRGNITEKARILDHTFEGLDSRSLQGEQVGDTSVVDMYAGIGYFVYSYLKRGVKRVWGWEINGWSVEGLRRGCIANGWGCKVIGVNDRGELDISVREFVDALRDTDRVVAFHGDNSFAPGILQQIRHAIEDGGNQWHSVRHVNLGLLPSSYLAWEGACKMIDMQKGGWVHVHENVDIREIDRKKENVTAELKQLRTRAREEASDRQAKTIADCRHVEQVKTYAPGVIHCVFDIKLS